MEIAARIKGASKEYKTGAVPHSVNSAMVAVSEVVGVGKVEPEKEIISLAAATGGIVKEIYRNDGGHDVLPIRLIVEEKTLLRV